MKTRINPVAVAMYILLPALALGFAASLLPALFGSPALTKTIGLAGAGIGAVAGLVYGLAVRFR